MRDSNPAPAPLSPKDVTSIIIGLMMVMLLAALDQTIVSTALPTIGRQLHDLEHLPWMVTAYLLSSTVVTPLYGKLADIIGRRTTILSAIVIFLLGSALCGLARDMYMLIAARAVQGLGGGGLMSLVQTVISDVVPLKERGKMQGYFAGVFTSASLGGVVLGGVMSDHFGWASIFWINIPFGLLALAIVGKALMKLPRHERPHKLDWIGAVLMTVAAVSLMMALEVRGGVILGVPVWVFYGASLVFWLLFGWRLMAAEEPLIPVSVLKNGAVIRSTMMSTLAMGALMGVGVYNPLYIQLVFHLNPTNAGLSLAPLGLAVVAGAIVSGRMMARGKGERYKAAPMTGLAVGTLAYTGLALFPQGLPLWGYIAVLALANMAIGTTFPVSISVVQGSVERHQMGTATGLMNFFRSLGGTLMVAIFGAVLFAELFMLLGHQVTGILSPQMLEGLPHPALVFRPIFIGAALSMGLSFAVLWTLEEKPLRGMAPDVAKAVEAASGEVLEDADFSGGPKK
ncbi:MAG: MFS transporter [Asticcacaulis sp.]|nr:MFS transporter [Asticcacaulis sp.]